MTFFVTSFIVSLVATLFLIRSGDRHLRLTADHDLTGPQKFHSRAVPRIGGLGVMAGALAGAALTALSDLSRADSIALLLIAGLPSFIMGIVEDLTKAVSPRRRLLASAVSALLGVFLLDAVIRRSAIPGIDYLIGMAPLAIALTVLCVTGVANAVNIIDGFNGLASMCVTLCMLAIAYVAFQVGDELVMTATLVTAGAILGFFIWNFPAGLIFLGDGGAYLLGFLLAETNILLLARNPSVSPIFSLLLCAYPIFETVFSMYRRKFVRGVATAAPDGIHLHTLIHRRILRASVGSTHERRQTRRNSMTSPYLWVLCLMSIIPSMLWWNNTLLLTLSLFAFIGLYVLLYWSIVHFKTPKWLFLQRSI